MAKIFSTHRRMIISLPESSRTRPSDSPKGEDRATARAPVQTLRGLELACSCLFSIIKGKTAEGRGQRVLGLVCGAESLGVMRGA